ncbi:hypothetical protein ALC57_15215 [Trachymyrmex cornetzi]|uniref:Uncharacterized protein n=1 Tax=Trachymyrmex cornetzi TaxID=471704 RepID=A0A195DHW3_9HYME|nr:hypothetical protein ALC57_15215 [Trachymyrmex cornetzi]
MDLPRGSAALVSQRDAFFPSADCCSSNSRRCDSDSRAKLRSWRSQFLHRELNSSKLHTGSSPRSQSGGFNRWPVNEKTETSRQRVCESDGEDQNYTDVAALGRRLEMRRP